MPPTCTPMRTVFGYFNGGRKTESPNCLYRTSPPTYERALQSFQTPGRLAAMSVPRLFPRPKWFIMRGQGTKDTNPFRPVQFALEGPKHNGGRFVPESGILRGHPCRMPDTGHYEELLGFLNQIMHHRSLHRPPEFACGVWLLTRGVTFTQSCSGKAMS